MSNGKEAIIFAIVFALTASILVEISQALAQLPPPTENQSIGTDAVNITGNNTMANNTTVANTTLDQAFDSLRDTFGSLFKK